jgi:RNA polymerase sigma-70 factor, ECF subfamily
MDAALCGARRGDEWAVTVLFRALNPGLIRYLRHHARGAEEDLASEVWAGAAAMLHRFEGDAHAFRALLFTLARRRVVDHYRKMGHAPSLVELGDGPDVAGHVDVEDAVISELSAQEAIEALLKGLPRTQAEVVLLRVVGELSVPEVAEVLGRSPGSVRVLQHRALQHLAKKFRKSVTL